MIDVLQMRNGFTAWCRLLRVPNLFTVPGDILAGSALAGVATESLFLLPVGAAVSLLLYASGVVLNDYTDRKLDCLERPERPIPSGQIKAAHALATGIAVMALGLIISIWMGLTDRFFPIFAVLLTGLILLYNGPARRIPAAGFIVMGLCRGTNLLLGATLGSGRVPMVLAGAVIVTLYVVLVSWLARGEASGETVFAGRWLPLGALAAAPLLLPGGSGLLLPGVVLFIAWFVAGFRQPWTLPAEIPVKISRLITGLILLQGMLVVSAGSYNPVGFTGAVVVFLALMYAAAAWTGKYFRGS